MRLEGRTAIVTGAAQGIGLATAERCAAEGARLVLADANGAKLRAAAKKLRDAGAVILGKVNLHELALGLTTVSSLGGQTLDPYDLTRAPGGSSGGSAVVATANFAAVTLGTDTSGSIRIPSSHNNVVGLRPSLGLSSRTGIIPFGHTQDTGGPIARTVEDIALILDVTAGYDPADPVTAASQGKRADSYMKFLDKDGVRGMRLGVVRQLFTAQNTDPDVMKRMEEALADLRRLGAQLVDPVNIPEIDTIPPGMLFCFRFKFDINDYLPRLAPDAQVKTLEDIIKSAKFHPSIEKRLLDRQAEPPLTENPRCAQVAQNTQRMREAVQKVMDDHTLDALVYPTWAFPPRMIGDLNTPHGNNSPRLSPPTGFPAITVPMGFVRDTLPVGLQVLGRAWSEPTLIKIVYGYEQATRHRRPPATTPPLPARP